MEDNKSDWQPISGFVSAVDDLDGFIEDVEATRLVQEGDITGVTKNKGEVEASLVKKAINISGAIQAYAIDQDNVQLRQRVTVTKSDLEKLRDTILRDQCLIILKEAQKIGASLNDYGVSAGEVSDFETVIEDFRAILAKPRVAITNRKTATEDLAKHLASCTSVYKDRIDKLMLNFEDSHTHFFENYRNARAIADV